MKKFAQLLFSGLLGGALVWGAQVLTEEPQVVAYQQPQPNIVRTSNVVGAAEAVDFTTAAENSVNAVVHVKTTFQAQTYYNPFGRFFGQPYYQAEPARGSGSGVIISPDGYIVTNNHVIDGAQFVEVTLNNNETKEAEVVGTDPATDLALLKIQGQNLPVIPIGNSDDVKIGEWVLAVGNPFNLTSTVTAGIVSAKARNINILEYDPAQDIFPIESFIQTDAAVNPGNSGGALVNTRGELVGINTAIASRTGSYAGYSFAIPSSIVRKVTGDLVEYGMVQRAYIGVNISDINQQLAESEDLGRLDGAYVRGLVDNGAAADAGIREGDIIVSVNGIAVRNVTQLQEQVGKYRPGDEVKVGVWRKGENREVNVLLKGRDGSTDLKARELTASKVSLLGAELKAATKDDLERLKLYYGVQVETLGTGKFAESGMKKGFIITRIDNQPVRTPADVQRILENREGGVLVEGIYPNGVTAYYGFGL